MKKIRQTGVFLINWVSKHLFVCVYIYCEVLKVVMFLNWTTPSVHRLFTILKSVSTAIARTVPMVCKTWKGRHRTWPFPSHFFACLLCCKESFIVLLCNLLKCVSCMNPIIYFLVCHFTSHYVTASP